MKKNKKGFSLAEVLIALGIISIIATMCFSIANKGIDRAYDMYVYTGYKGISDAIASEITNNLQLTGSTNLNTNPFVIGIADLFDVDSGITQPDAASAQFTTPNGIIYKIGYSRQDAVFGDEYYIEMRIPARKTSTDMNNEVVCLYYTPHYNVLIPYNTDTSCTSTGKGVNLRDRVDLLPFYIDNGQVGRVVNGIYQRKTYDSFAEIFCRLNPNADIKGLTCNNAAATNGIMRLENPQKL